MIAAVLALLLLGVPAPAPAQELEPGSPHRFLQLPDVTLSAEDPLYLSPPPVAGRPEPRVGQPALDWLALDPVEAPSRTVPPPELLGAPSFAGLSLAAIPGPPAPGDRQPSSSPLPVRTPAREANTWEYGAEFRHVFMESTFAGLRLDGDRGSWRTSGEGAFLLTDAFPSIASFELQFARAAQPWQWDLDAGGTAAFSSDTFQAGDLEARAGLLLDGGRFRFQSRTVARFEHWRVDAGAAGWISQELAANSAGPGFGLYGSALASLLFAPGDADPQPDALARLGVSWKGERIPLDLRAGAALLYYGGEPAGYPEAGIELRPARILRLQAWLAPFLEAPIGLQFRAINDPSSESGLHDQGGIAAGGGLVLDWPRVGGVGITVQARDGSRYRLRGGALHWERAQELQLDLESSWTVLAGSTRRPGVTLRFGASSSLPLPAPEQPLAHLLWYDLDGAFTFIFPKLPLELIMQAHWGDFPLPADQALITGSQGIFSGWMASLLVRGGQERRLAWFGGLEVRQPAEVRVVLGWATHARIGP